MGQSQERERERGRERGKEEDMSMITILMLLLMMMHALVVAFKAGRQSHRKGICIRFHHQQQDKNREEKAPPPPPDRIPSALLYETVPPKPIPPGLDHEEPASFDLITPTPLSAAYCMLKSEGAAIIC